MMGTHTSVWATRHFLQHAVTLQMGEVQGYGHEGAARLRTAVADAVQSQDAEAYLVQLRESLLKDAGYTSLTAYRLDIDCVGAVAYVVGLESGSDLDLLYYLDGTIEAARWLACGE